MRNYTLLDTWNISSCGAASWIEENPTTLPALSIEDWIIAAIKSYIAFFRKLIIDPPFVVSGSILGVKRYVL